MKDITTIFALCLLGALCIVQSCERKGLKALETDTNSLKDANRNIVAQINNQTAAINVLYTNAIRLESMIISFMPKPNTNK